MHIDLVTGIRSVETYYRFTQLDSIDDVDHLAAMPGANLNIYFIVRRPRVSIKPGSLVQKGIFLEGVLLIHREDGDVEEPFRTKHAFGARPVDLHCPRPHNVLTVRRRDTGKEYPIKVSLMVRDMSDTTIDRLKLLDLEVCYIGQAYGKKRRRTASERLKAHEKYQAILHDTLHNKPWMEVWCYMADFEVHVTSVVYGDPSVPGVPDREAYSAKARRSTQQHKRIQLDTQVRINFTEAGLIHHFQPEYNDRLKRRFPDESHTGYWETVKQFDFVGVQMATGEMRARLYSAVVPPQLQHEFWYSTSSAAPVPQALATALNKQHPVDKLFKFNVEEDDFGSLSPEIRFTTQPFSARKKK